MKSGWLCVSPYRTVHFVRDGKTLCGIVADDVKPINKATAIYCETCQRYTGSVRQ